MEQGRSVDGDAEEIPPELLPELLATQVTCAESAYVLRSRHASSFTSKVQGCVHEGRRATLMVAGTDELRPTSDTGISSLLRLVGLCYDCASCCLSVCTFESETLAELLRSIVALP